MDEVSAPPGPPGPTTAEHLTYEEVLAALDQLTPLELARLSDIERGHFAGTDFGDGELLQEAVDAALFEEKKCPRTVPFPAFLAQSMRNVAGRRRVALARQVPPEDAKTGDGKDKSPLWDPTPSPEDVMIKAEQNQRASEVWAKLGPQYSADEEMSMVLLGWEDDMRGEKLRDFVGVDQTRLDYVIKKIRRIARRAYPKGWEL
jgi:hypothetical protein